MTATVGAAGADAPPRAPRASIPSARPDTTVAPSAGDRVGDAPARRPPDRGRAPRADDRRRRAAGRAPPAIAARYSTGGGRSIRRRRAGIGRVREGERRARRLGGAASRQRSGSRAAAATLARRDRGGQRRRPAVAGRPSPRRARRRDRDAASPPRSTAARVPERPDQPRERHRTHALDAVEDDPRVPLRVVEAPRRRRPGHAPGTRRAVRPASPPPIGASDRRQRALAARRRASAGRPQRHAGRPGARNRAASSRWSAATRRRPVEVRDRPRDPQQPLRPAPGQPLALGEHDRAAPWPPASRRQIARSARPADAAVRQRRPSGAAGAPGRRRSARRRRADASGRDPADQHRRRHAVDA